MARVTVEDCLDEMENRFQLVLVATKRARQIANGAEAMVDIENDKPTVVALREIAEGLVGPSILVEKPPVEFDEESVFGAPDEVDASESKEPKAQSADEAKEASASPEPTSE